jgi:hypothetical protein
MWRRAKARILIYRDWLVPLALVQTGEVVKRMSWWPPRSKDHQMRQMR